MFLAVIIAAAFVFFEGDSPAVEIDAKYSNSYSQFLVTEDGARIHFRDQGNAEGAPIVLVHGAMASLHTWEPWVALLGNDYRVITLDLPAHGLTGAVENSAYGADAFTETIDAVAKAVGLDSFVLGGNSMGGGATWRYALAHPERVSAMVLVDAVAPGPWGQAQARETDDAEEGEQRSPTAFALLQQPWFRAIARYLDPALLIKQGLMSAYNNSPVVTETLVERYYDLIMRKGTRAAILSRTGELGAESPQLSDLAKLDQPTLILWGAQDSVIPVATAKLFEEHLPTTTTVIFEDLGHIPMEEDPERTAAAVHAFLTRLARDG